MTRELAERQRARLEEDGLTRLFDEVELPLVDVLVDMEREGVKLDVERLGRDRRELRPGRATSSGASRSWPARSSRSARRSSWRTILFDKLELSKKRRGKTGFSTDARVLQAIRAEHEIIPADRGVARVLEAQVDLPRRLARADRRRRPAAHDLQPDRRRHRPPVEHRPEPPEHPDPDRARPRDPRLLRRRAGQQADRVPTTRRSSCASSPTSRTSRCCGTSSRAARTSTPPPPR